MPHTGREYGLEINEHVDERYDLAKSTRAACKYFKQAHRKFKTWTLTAVSYNMGITGLKKRLRKQSSDNYYELRLNKESSRYIYRVVAVKDILSHPANYNFKLKPHHKYSPIRTKKIKVNYEIADLSEWANQKGINFKILKMFNPWLRSNQLPNSEQKVYFIELPFERIATFSEETKVSEPISSISINHSDEKR
jgi:membrane-bound lytic murein transglycosylase D